MRLSKTLLNLLLIYTPLYCSANAGSDLQLTWVNTAVGTCQIVSCPVVDSNTPSPIIIVDCGTKGGRGKSFVQNRSLFGINNNPEDNIRSVMAEYSADRDITVVVSHGDGDHYNQIDTVITGREDKVTKVYYGGILSNYGPKSKFLKLNINGELIAKPGAVDQEIECGGASATIISAFKDRNKNKKNLNSIVLFLEYKGMRVLLTGDAWGQTQEQANTWINNNRTSSPFTILVSSHHGAHGHGSNNRKWADFIKPKIVIHPSGTGSADKFGHPFSRITQFYEPHVKKGFPEHWMSSCTNQPPGRYVGRVLTLSCSKYLTQDAQYSVAPYKSIKATIDVSGQVYITLGEENSGDRASKVFGIAQRIRDSEDDLGIIFVQEKGIDELSIQNTKIVKKTLSKNRSRRRSKRLMERMKPKSNPSL